MAIKISSMKLVLGLWSSLLLLSCSHQRAQTANSNYELRGDTIIVSAKSALATKIKVDTLAEELYRGTIKIPGIVKAIPNQYAEVASPFAGRIVKSYMRLGMKVKAGSPLFEISSQGFMDAQKVFFQQKAQLLLAEKVYRRQQDLLTHGVSSQKEYDEALTSYNVAKQEFDNAANGIRVFNADPGHMILGQPLVVTAPIAGEIIANRIVVGQFIKMEEPSVATVAELSTIWVAAQVKEKDLPALRSVNDCEISGVGFPDTSMRGRIYHIGDQVDEQTHSIPVLVACSNPLHLLKPGMFVTVDFKPSAISSILIPQRAILQTRNDHVVFRQIKRGTYLRQVIQVTNTETGKMLVRRGLVKNDLIITDGAYYFSGIK
ncbi:hypothetical protein UNH65_17525 [Chitinophaga sp. 180180018-2]|nr:hypothetical protein [Chitinophaga sp. 212800010-3]